MPKLITVGELIDKSWDHYRDNFFDLMSVSGWILIIAIVDIIALAFYPTTTTLLTSGNLNLIEKFGVLLFSFNAWVIAPLLGLWVFISLVRLIIQQKGRTSSNVKLAMKEGWQFFIPTLIVSILVLLVLVGGILIGLGPGFLLAALASAVGNGSLIVIANLLVVVGIFAAFILNIRWTIHYILAPLSLLIENKTGTNALTRSHMLVKGKFWRVLFLLAIPKLVFILVGAAIMALLAYLTNIAVAGAAGLNLDVQLRLLSVTSSIFPIVLAVLINPLLTIADVLLYKNLKEVTTIPKK